MKTAARANSMLAIACAVTMCIAQMGGRAAAQASSFTVHGARKSCSDITQLDSVLTSGERAYFAGWTERDYADALAWSEACKDYGWHIAGKPRVGLLKAQRDKALPPPVSFAGVAPGAITPPWVTRAVLPVTGAASAQGDPLLSDAYYNAHFHGEAVWVAAQAHLDIGQDRGASNWVSDGTASQLKNRLTADKIVMFCGTGATVKRSRRPLTSGWWWTTNFRRPAVASSSAARVSTVICTSNTASKLSPRTENPRLGRPPLVRH